ncbi:AbrB/MazE/SpoVT family DNA-binding domain-containing protein [Rhizobium leguminosarum]|uniref:AbrB/MazE/SpoVT family DNA-binding domain-containing protein n=1 Tax=Rhizobium leguminosarum TaxID=384 RepID=UPI001A9291B8|nr:AbrB/MazE/SpoVT family DNA-binding domain-containing protein [Rhizobium leguminosarum]MBY5557108.1 AbrB/MazE/SpoVT family DNA-binding domain-containing protein [Rhizobium leguminosarum]MBY5637641.1 AbrB/MazE/SpoVT family DNA-binding domain-containing protein [Rhizobium leguminosarum]MBY5693048.1 AbrB/MazE/SpoVT family DNA-binding domain-containing protein [Rhizobium leguminosarum]MBY5727265.1 AbrB/MazE/SpoVT family DNA-binding domain-containing protein [Rhizobium leguminosarum]MBY5746685.1 
MAHSENLITTVSTKGQIILPKTIRQRREWEAGTRLIVEETPEGVLLKQTPAFAPTWPDDVFGMLPFCGEPKTLEEMEAGMLAEARRREGPEFADGI